jgi:hypothetical protein
LIQATRFNIEALRIEMVDAKFGREDMEGQSVKAVL